MSHPSQETVRELHQVYCNKARMTLTLSMDRLLAWEMFAMRFTAMDLGLVIDYLNAGIAKGERNPGALRFRNLVQDLDHFEEELALANTATLKRPIHKRVQTDRDRALLATGRPDTQAIEAAKPNVATAAQVLPNVINELEKGWAALRAVVATTAPAATEAPVDKAEALRRFHQDSQKNQAAGS